MVPEAEKEEVFDSDVEIEGEPFIPQGGLFVPGFYSPANEISKACGLAYFFPKVNAPRHRYKKTRINASEWVGTHDLLVSPSLL